ncbi:MAG: alpha/beta hydrolase [Candidatus Methylarchaceae archaeon HK02M2]|nr:alpha/beta hydrolase [Candidatus Methylarchaceae archaeon HK02M2]
MPERLIGDIEIYYEITGEGEPLLLVHGLGSSTRDWEEQVPIFSQKYQVITVDIRGHGQTDKPKGPYSISKFAKDIAELVMSLGFTSVNALGLSLGGMIAIQLTIDYPELIKTLVIANTDAVSRDLALLEKIKSDRIKAIKSRGMRGMGEVLAPALFIKPEHEELRKKFVERWAENNQEAYINALKSIAGWNVADQLHTIKCPTLVLASDEDYTPVSVKEEMVKQIQNSQVIVIKDARHFLPLERPTEFNAAVMEFLSKH